MLACCSGLTTVLLVTHDLVAMETSDLRREILQVLREESQTHVNAIESRIRQRCDDYSRGDALLLQEVIWELLLQGVLAPGKNSLNLHLPFLHLTTYGARCLEEDALLLHDSTEYLSRFGDEADDEVILAVHEALQCFLSGRAVAAVSMLAGAGERLIDRLASAVIDSRPPGRAQGALRSQLTKAGRDAVRRASIVQQALPGALQDEVHVHLGDLVALLRLTRDKDGLALARTVELERAHAALLTFPSTYCWIQQVIDHLAGIAGRYRTAGS